MKKNLAVKLSLATTILTSFIPTAAKDLPCYH
jgi:hypothetical protein